MGYYSDVTIVTTKDTYEDFMIEYAKRFPDSIFNPEVEELEDSRYVRMDWYGAKWYREFEDVNFICSYFLDKDNYYEFMRIGEEMDDIEYLANMLDDEDYRLYCHRSAEVW